MKMRKSRIKQGWLKSLKATVAIIRDFEEIIRWKIKNILWKIDHQANVLTNLKRGKNLLR